MCDRCSHSRLRAPDLNNSPRADNPSLQDHLHGKAAEARKTSVSVHLSASAPLPAPSAQGRSRLPPLSPGRLVDPAVLPSSSGFLIDQGFPPPRHFRSAETCFFFPLVGSCSFLLLGPQGGRKKINEDSPCTGITLTVLSLW